MATTTSSPSEKNAFLSIQSAGRCVQCLADNILSHFPFSALLSCRAAISSKITPPSPPSSVVTGPFVLSSFSSYSPGRNVNQTLPSSATRSFSSGVRVDGAGLSGKGRDARGPAFVGQVFSMLDPSGNGLMTFSTHFDIPFITERLPEWFKDIFARITKNKQDGPVFRFFMDINDAATYVKRLNVPTGIVGACRLDVAYEHFKAKPHMFQFIPNKEQVKAANKLLNTRPKKHRRRKVSGVPVFTAENLNIAIATTDGIEWYTPYFFDKNLLDNILEASVDQHFHTLIHCRRIQRRQDIIDDGPNVGMEENLDSLFEPQEVQELLTEMDHSALPLSVISKAAEIQFLDVIDKALLGNKWLRKVTGIQPKLPYIVDSFEERTAACFQKTSALSTSANQEISLNDEDQLNPLASNCSCSESGRGDNVSSVSQMEYQFPFGDWFFYPWSRLQGKQHKSKGHVNSRMLESEDNSNHIPPNPLLPKITMVGISMGDGSHINEASLKKTMEDLTKDLKQEKQKSTSPNKDKDPLFVANVGDFSSIARMNLA